MIDPDAFLKICPSRSIVARLSGKWPLLILALLKEEPMRFGEIKRQIEGISQKVLTENLRSLERDGLLTRTVYDEMPLRVEYKATPFASDLSAIVRQIKYWSEENMHLIHENNKKYDTKKDNEKQLF
ncbi:winged helix-turn-helix transcriptional regulator [Curvivirga sp.]|uniref:winged helix-turn-helix transcriptional regulator n=1 Tax=Curvivirga sp. TaxID=2856848 RepID=UPI003B598E5E